VEFKKRKCVDKPSDRIPRYSSSSLSVLNPVLAKFVTSALDPAVPRLHMNGRSADTEELHDVHEELAGVPHGQVERLAGRSQLRGHGAQVASGRGAGGPPRGGGGQRR